MPRTTREHPEPMGPTRQARRTTKRSLAVETFAQQLRADADRILAAHGVEIRAKTLQAIAEHEAA